MSFGKFSRRGLKICLGVSVLFVIIVAVVIVTLLFTTFKQKDPMITVHPDGFKDIKIPSSLSNSTVNVDTVITIENPNYAGFKFINSTAYVNFDDTMVAEVPIGSDFVPAHSAINVTTAADFMVGKLIGDPRFWEELAANMTFNLKSSATLPGKAIFLKIFKFKATAYSSCDILVNISSRDVETKCTHKIKL